jgi:hypothetical protein
MDEWEGKFGTIDGLIPLVGQKRHSLGAGTVDRATATSGVKVAQHPEGLDLDASARRGRKMTVGYQANFLRRGHRYPRPLSGGGPEEPTSLRQTCLSVSSRLLVGVSFPKIISERIGDAAQPRS